MALRVKYFAVIGSGAFPMDMLRYDRCWPVNSDDAANLTDYSNNDGKPLVRRAVALATIADRVESARWSSFGWTASSLFTDHTRVNDWVRSIMGGR